MNQKRSKTVKIVLALVLALAMVFTLASCSMSDLFGRDSDSGTKTIDGTYQLAIGDSNVELSDSDVAQNVAYLMMPATVEIFSTETYKSTTYSSGGTGFIVTNDGYVVTNSHVIHYTAKYTSGSGYWGGKEVEEERLYSDSNIKLKFYSSDETFSARVVAYDEALDLAVLKFNNLPEGGFERTAVFADSDQLKYGQVAVAIGNANGLGLAVTQGVVSAPSRVFDNEDGTTTEAIQTDAAINPGNSGGPLFDKSARVIGVNSFKLVTDNTENMAYAIPSNVVMKYIDSVERTKGVSIEYVLA